MANVIVNVDTLAQEIRAEHEHAFGKAREALEHARRAGELLIEAKRQVGHGGWLGWLRENVQFSERTAQGYMKLASGWATLQAKSATVADLGLRDALALLATPTEPKVTESPAADPWMSLTPERRAEHCERWPDARIAEVLFLDACGWSELRIAEFLGLGVDIIDATLYPRCAPMLGLSDFRGGAAIAIPALAAATVDSMLWSAWEKVSWRAERDPLADDGARMLIAAKLRDARRRAARRNDIEDSLGIFGDDFRLALMLFAWDVARDALRIEGKEPARSFHALFEYIRWEEIIERARSETAS